MTDLQKLFDIGYSSACHDRVALSWFTYEQRPGRVYDNFNVVTATDRRIQISVSPQGRSIRIFVDGEEVR